MPELGRNLVPSRPQLPLLILLFKQGAVASLLEKLALTALKLAAKVKPGFVYFFRQVVGSRTLFKNKILALRLGFWISTGWFPPYA